LKVKVSVELTADNYNRHASTSAVLLDSNAAESPQHRDYEWGFFVYGSQRLDGSRGVVLVGKNKMDGDVAFCFFFFLAGF